jgi:glucosylceramidase
MPLSRGRYAGALLFAAAAVASAPTRAAPHGDPRVRVVETRADQSLLLSVRPSLKLQRLRRAAGAHALRVDTAKTYQSMIGFGAAITDASAFVLNHDLQPAQREALLAELFGPQGLHLSFVRLTIGASDFSTARYSYDDPPHGVDDPALAQFSLKPAEADVIPVAKRALAFNPDLTFMASPWSAPAWMKSTRNAIGGTLRPEAYGAYADYLIRYVTAMGEAGLPIAALTIQNEPGFTPGDYPGMRLTPAARAEFIGRFLGPRLAAAKAHTRIWDYDHNWDRPDSPLAVLKDARAGRYIAGVAWHCYNGKVGAQSRVHDAAPDKDAIFTECSSGAWNGSWSKSFGILMRQLIIGAPNNWARGVALWNLALDERHGPHLGGCGDCSGVVAVDSRTGVVTRNPEYYALGHASRFVRPGARRVALRGRERDVDAVAFVDPRDGQTTLIAFNHASTQRRLQVQAGNGRGFNYLLKPGAAATFTWTGPVP